MISSAIASAVLGAVAAFVAVLALLNVAGAHYFAVSSNSMTPFMQRGDLVVTSPRGALSIGDAVTYAIYGRIVTHRIVAPGREPGTYETRGDANRGNDPWTISAADVIGKVRSVVPRAGWPLLFLGAPTGRFMMYACVAGSVVVLWWTWPKVIYSQALP